MEHPFKWGDTPPDWFMREIAKALRLMGANGEVVHGFDTKEFTFIQVVCPVSKSGELAQAVGEAYLRVVGEGAPVPLGAHGGGGAGGSSIDFREFTLLAVDGLNKKAARRVAQLLDVAIAFGAMEHARGNASMQDIAAVERRALEVLARVRQKNERVH